MLIDQLKKDAVISQYFCDECKENDVSIEIDETIAVEDILIIKVDDYYNANVPLDRRPKSPDCLIIQRCAEQIYDIHIVELRNIANSDGFTVQEIKEKFITCLNDFMYGRFAKHFVSEDFVYEKFDLVFVSDPYGFKKDPNREKKMRGHKLDAFIGLRIPNFFGKHLYINPRVPNPKIEKCKAA